MIILYQKLRQTIKKTNEMQYHKVKERFVFLFTGNYSQGDLLGYM